MRQRSDEWFIARCGSVGASRIADVVARTKTGWGASRANYLAELLLERLTGRPTESFVTAAMQNGIDLEPEARAAYSFMTDASVQEVGLIRHPTIVGSHCSPDGLLGDDGVLELKCPQPAAHLETLLSGRVPEKYVKQMTWQMACCGRRFADYVSYNPTFPPSMQMWTSRIHRDDEVISDLEDLVRLFLEELEGKVSELRQRYGAEGATGAAVPLRPTEE